MIERDFWRGKDFFSHRGQGDHREPKTLFLMSELQNVAANDFLPMPPVREARATLKKQPFHFTAERLYSIAPGWTPKAAYPGNDGSLDFFLPRRGWINKT